MAKDAKSMLLTAALTLSLMVFGCAAPGGGHTVESQAYPFYSLEDLEAAASETTDDEEAEPSPKEAEPSPEEAEPSPEEEAEETYTVGRQEAVDEEEPVIEDNAITEMTLYFLDGQRDIPYLAVSEWTKLLGTAFPLAYDASGSKAVVERTDTGYTVTFDADKDTVTFFDYDAFLQTPGSELLVSGTSTSWLPEDNDGQVFSATAASYNRNGKEVVFELAPYEIDIVQEDGEFLLPLQTFNDFCLSYLGAFVYFDGEGLAIGPETIDTLIALKELPETTISAELAAFNYHELCFLLDYFYGLKDTHDIVSFDAFFDELGLRERLSSTDPRETEDALYDFIYLHLDDIHSQYYTASPLSGAGYEPEAQQNHVYGFSRVTNDVDEAHYKGTRTSYFPDGCPAYQEVGDTAFITFDGFTSALTDYYAEADLDNPQDTIALIAAAHAQITREGSPIKNVVIDLSCNTGGVADAAAYVMGWYLGEAPIALRDTLSGGMSIGIYRVDTNLDGTFDEADELGDRNLYCLTSPVSFSCGNLVPAAFKNSGRVTLLGRQTCGGSCVVFQAMDALGTRFTISGNRQCSITKNGSFYNIDEGIAPDYTLNNADSYYDRERLVEYIHGLM